MKKFFITIVLVFVYGFATYACYEKNYPITVTQPDGAVVQCFTTGDEFYRWVHDADGFTMIQDPQTGVVVYAKLENDELVSTGYRVGSVDPATVGLTPWLNISAEKRMQIRSDFLKNIPEKPVNEGYQATRSGKNDGTLNNLVIYIRFAGEAEFPANKAKTYEDMHNKDEERFASMYGYFKAISNGKTLIRSTFYPKSSGDFITSYQDIYTRKYFQPYHATNNPDGYTNEYEAMNRGQQMFKRALEYIAHEVPGDLDLDFNGDGLIDNISFIVSGTTGAWASFLWPHRSALYYLQYEPVIINGKKAWDYNLQVEKHLDGSKSSVLSHEMFHTLGAPDLYRYYDEKIDPVGSWDLMCSNTNPPQSPTVYMKWKYGGWVDDIPELPGNGTYSLKNTWSETNNAYKIKSPSSTVGEFFVIEYRDKSVYWDSGIPGSGILIYRINPNWEGNADGPPDELYIFRPGGYNNTTSGNISAANFSANAGRVAFNNVSNPPCFLTNNKPGDIALYIGGIEGDSIVFEADNSMLYSELIVSPESLTFADIPIGTTSEPQTITVSGKELNYELLYEISGTGSELFSIKKTSWNAFDGGTLAVTFTPDAAKIYNVKATFTAIGATPKSITLKGSGKSVAIDEHYATDNITIYPNPTDGMFNVSSLKFKVENVEIFDVMGKKVQSSEFNVQSSETRNYEVEQFPSFGGVRGGLNISHLPSGVYFIRIQTENGVVTKKVVKM
jgi:M6 family metalloprotease-like protein